MCIVFVGANTDHKLRCHIIIHNIIHNVMHVHMHVRTHANPNAVITCDIVCMYILEIHANYDN